MRGDGLRRERALSAEKGLSIIRPWVKSGPCSNPYDSAGSSACRLV
jgi:hypothetical protein